MPKKKDETWLRDRAYTMLVEMAIVVNSGEPDPKKMIAAYRHTTVAIHELILELIL